jgi:hypothetical protein
MALCHKAIDGVAAGTAMVDSNGNVYGYPTYSNGEVMNPVAETNYRFRGNIDTDRMLSTVYAKLTLAEGLTVTSRLGYERSNSIDSRWNPIYYITSEAQNSSVTLRNNISRNSRWLWENFASYTKKLENITLQVYWDTQLKKKESILFFKRFRSSIAIRTIRLFRFHKQK